MIRPAMINLEKLRDVTKIQGSSGNWDVDEYMRGIYNGLELALSIMEDREPVYKDAPPRSGKMKNKIDWGDLPKKLRASVENELAPLKRAKEVEKELGTQMPRGFVQGDSGDED